MVPQERVRVDVFVCACEFGYRDVYFVVCTHCIRKCESLGVCCALFVVCVCVGDRLWVPHPSSWPVNTVTTTS